ncbi:hypothetical protein VTN02DRAFT_4161 [Thermoascus thermophilus]
MRAPIQPPCLEDLRRHCQHGRRAAEDTKLALQCFDKAYETGVSALLLHIVGTLPVTFRGAVYKFPIDLWIPTTYPFEPPIVYVTPTQDMVVRVGQHVTLEGRVYHHYLAHWAEAWDRSSIVDLLSILREIFAKEPPVKYKQQQMRPPQPPQLPPLPPEFSARSSQTPPPPPPQPAPQMPPPPPPKPGKVQTPEQQQPPAQGRYQSPPPPPPPLPPKAPDPRQESFQYQHEPNGALGQRASQFMPQRSSSLRDAATTQPQPPQPPSAPPKQPHQQRPFYSPEERRGPGSPLSRTVEPTIPSLQPSVAYGNHQQQLASQLPQGQHLHGHQQPHLPYQHQPVPQQQQQPQQQYLPPQQPVPLTQPPAPAPAPKTETPDLLTSPFELELPTVSPSGPAPPIPPNPEKDALLRALSKTLTETLQSHVSKSKSAVQPLLSQSSALQAAITKLQGEIAALNSLNATLQSNTAILQQSLHRADAVIADAQARMSTPPDAGEATSSTAADGRGSGLPPIDDVLVAPTVVGKQLYDLVADERGIQQAIYALQAALVKGIIGVDTWSRHTRGLAREAFFKRALIRKIGKGMGLEGS